MFLPQSRLQAVLLAASIAAGTNLCAVRSPGQSPADQGSPSPASAQPAPAAAGPATQAAASSQPSSEPAGPARKTYTVPAGTKVLLKLDSAINTRSAKPGDGVYLSSIFPVVVGDRVLIPTGVYVQGVVDRVRRGGHVKGRAQLDMHFTSIIFPNGSVAEIPGVVDSLPGSKNQTVKNDQEGTIEQNGDKGRNAGEVAKIAIPSGAGVGTIGGAESGHPIEGGLAGLGAGLAAVGIVSLFTRNADVEIPNGTQVEMVLQRPLLLEKQNLAGTAQSGSAPSFVPSANQPRPIEKPVRVLCPPGSLGCE